MELKNSWFFRINKNIQEQKGKIHKKDYKFFQVNIILKIAKYTQKFAGECTACDKNKEIIENLTENLDISINNSVVARRKFSNKIDKLTNHLKKEHKIFYEGYFLSLYTIIGIVVGTLLGTLIILPINIGLIKFGILFGFIAGIFAGRFFGKRKEKSIINSII